jgi:hypothetical protein
MIETPIVPDDPKELSRFLREYLGRISGTLQVLGEGQTYPSGKQSSKAQYWDDYLSSFNAGKVVGVNAPNWAVFRNGLYAWEFSATAMNEIWLAPIHITHSYKPGTAVYFHIHWAKAGTNTGTVRWGIEYSLAKGHNQSAFPASTTIYLEQAGSSTAYQHMVIEVSEGQAITTGIEPDTLLMIRIFRDAAHANDTCTDAVFGLMCDMHYQKSYWATKNKAPNFYK